jgi:hypothetical protein
MTDVTFDKMAMFPSARRLHDSRRLEAAIGFFRPFPTTGQVPEVTAQPLPAVT